MVRGSWAAPLTNSTLASTRRPTHLLARDPPLPPLRPGRRRQDARRLLLPMLGRRAGAVFIRCVCVRVDGAQVVCVREGTNGPPGEGGHMRRAFYASRTRHTRHDTTRAGRVLTAPHPPAQAPPPPRRGRRRRSHDGRACYALVSGWSRWDAPPRSSRQSAHAACWTGWGLDRSITVQGPNVS